MGQSTVLSPTLELPRIVSPLRSIWHTALIVIGLANSLGAQPVATTIAGTPTCRSCRITAESLFTLGKPTDQSRTRSITNIERDSRGRFYAVGDDLASVLVFDVQGRYVTSIGRRGAGPGEFPTRVRGIRLGAGDTLYVSLGRQIAVFGSDWQFIRQVRLSGEAFTFYPLADGTIVAGMVILTPDQIGLPFHILRADGSVARSFGPLSSRAARGSNSRAVSEPSVSPYSAFVLADDKKSIWVSAADYTMERWSLTGELVQRFVVRAPWIEPGSRPVTETVQTGQGRKSFVVTAVPSASFNGVDARGFLWYTGLIPVRGSRGTLERPPRMTLRREIIDPIAGRLMVSERVERSLALISGTDLGCGWDETDDGEVTLSIWRVTMRGVPAR